MTRHGFFAILSILAAAPLAPVAAQTLLWTRQTGTAVEDYGYGVAVDGAGNAYITGYTFGNLGGPNAGDADAFLAKYDASGAMLWTHQTGTTVNDQGNDVAVDIAGNAYIIGITNGSLGGPYAGNTDAFLAKYDAAGALLWMRQIGTAANDIGYGVAVDGAGNAYLTGATSGNLGGPNAGDRDAFLVKYDASGVLLWTRQMGTAAFDLSYGVAVDGEGNACIIGITDGSLGGPNAGDIDIFLAKYGPPPCYANCDNSTAAPILNVNDFSCFLNKYAAGSAYANCDGSTIVPVLNVNDFSCFLNKYAAGCP